MTQLEMARQGLPSPALERAAAEESISADRLRRLLACGRAVLPANPHHAGLRPLAIGKTLRTKVNVNLGTSKDFPEPRRRAGQGRYLPRATAPIRSWT